MKAEVIGLDGKKIKTIDLPEQFNEDYEPDLIKRAILAINSHGRQAYGTAYQAGMSHSAKLSRRRRNYKGSYGKGISRVPRKTMWRRGMQFGWVAANAPGTVGGRRAHPPKAQRIWDLKINKKERKKAIRSALSGAVLNSQLLIIEDKIENLKKIKDVKTVFTTLGLNITAKKIQRAGRGKSRGRGIKYSKNPLIVVAKKCDFINAVSNLPGYDVVDVKSLNAQLLTLGHDKIRKCIFTESAVSTIGKEKLFSGDKK
ncbi:50S ribosomal protein L4 [Candidatus Woesearchaeota archaeon]|nr:50S ribosomal protein L4P [uncultured archaeon]MBS3175160.1 50S ribosomal protein L4 [Candidatus Woesearchaeota archaeon]